LIMNANFAIFISHPADRNEGFLEPRFLQFKGEPKGN
jgi:hypothetical protein